MSTSVDAIVMPSKDVLRICENGMLGWMPPDGNTELIREMIGAESLLINEYLRLREGLAKIAGHSTYSNFLKASKA